MASYAAVEPDAVEIRVVACLVEKQRTTPDQYPLTLNSLRLACNQSTNRDPVVDYDEGTIRSALDRLGRRKWTTLASWSTARSVKYKHVLDQALGLAPPQLSLMTVLMLRGPQTPGELRSRRGQRYGHLLQGDGEVQPAEGPPPMPEHAAPGPAVGPAAPAADGELAERVDRLEAELSALRAELRGLRERLDA
jgi:uncharacterized protein